MGNLAVLRPISLVQSIRNKYTQPAIDPSAHDGNGSSSSSSGGGGSGGRPRVMLKEERIAEKQAKLDALSVSDATSLIEQVLSCPIPTYCRSALTTTFSSTTTAGFAAGGGG